MKRMGIVEAKTQGGLFPVGGARRLKKKIINKNKVKESKALGCQNGAGQGCDCLSNGFHIYLALSAATRIQDAQRDFQGLQGTAQWRTDLGRPHDGLLPAG